MTAFICVFAILFIVFLVRNFVAAKQIETGRNIHPGRDVDQDFFPLATDCIPFYGYYKSNGKSRNSRCNRLKFAFKAKMKRRKR